MASLTHADVAGLNQSLQHLGQTAVVNRQQAEAKRQAIEQEMVRREMLRQADERTAIDREQLGIQKEQFGIQKQGHIQAWLQGPEGGAMQFTGSRDGLTALLKQAADANKPLKMLEAAPTSKPQYGVFTTETPLGTMAIHMDKPEDVDKVTQIAKQLGGKPKTVRGFETKESYNLTQWQAMQAKADQLEAEAESVAGLTEAQKATMRYQAKRMRATADAFYKPTGETMTETITEETDPLDPTKTTTKRAISRKIPAARGESAGTGAALKFVRDPKTNRLVPQQ